MLLPPAFTFPLSLSLLSLLPLPSSSAPIVDSSSPAAASPDSLLTAAPVTATAPVPVSASASWAGNAIAAKWYGVPPWCRGYPPGGRPDRRCAGYPGMPRPNDPDQSHTFIPRAVGRDADVDVDVDESADKLGKVAGKRDGPGRPILCNYIPDDPYCQGQIIPPDPPRSPVVARDADVDADESADKPGKAAEKEKRLLPAPYCVIHPLAKICQVQTWSPPRSPVARDESDPPAIDELPGKGVAEKDKFVPPPGFCIRWPEDPWCRHRNGSKNPRRSPVVVAGDAPNGFPSVDWAEHVDPDKYPFGPRLDGRSAEGEPPIARDTEQQQRREEEAKGYCDLHPEKCPYGPLYPNWPADWPIPAARDTKQQQRRWEADIDTSWEPYTTNVYPAPYYGSIPPIARDAEQEQQQQRREEEAGNYCGVHPERCPYGPLYPDWPAQGPPPSARDTERRQRREEEAKGYCNLHPEKCPYGPLYPNWPAGVEQPIARDTERQQQQQRREEETGDYCGLHPERCPELYPDWPADGPVPIARDTEQEQRREEARDYCDLHPGQCPYGPPYLDWPIGAPPIARDAKQQQQRRAGGPWAPPPPPELLCKIDRQYCGLLREKEEKEEEASDLQPRKPGIFDFPCMFVPKLCERKAKRDDSVSAERLQRREPDGGFLCDIFPPLCDTGNSPSGNGKVKRDISVEAKQLQPRKPDGGPLCAIFPPLCDTGNIGSRRVKINSTSSRLPASASTEHLQPRRTRRWFPCFAPVPFCEDPGNVGVKRDDASLQAREPGGGFLCAIFPPLCDTGNTGSGRKEIDDTSSLLPASASASAKHLQPRKAPCWSPFPWWCPKNRVEKDDASSLLPASASASASAKHLQSRKPGGGPLCDFFPPLCDTGNTGSGKVKTDQADGDAVDVDVDVKAPLPPFPPDPIPPGFPPIFPPGFPPGPFEAEAEAEPDTVTAPAPTPTTLIARRHSEGEPTSSPSSKLSPFPQFPPGPFPPGLPPVFPPGPIPFSPRSADAKAEAEAEAAPLPPYPPYPPGIPPIFPPGPVPYAEAKAEAEYLPPWVPYPPGGPFEPPIRQAEAEATTASASASAPAPDPTTLIARRDANEEDEPTLSSSSSSFPLAKSRPSSYYTSEPIRPADPDAYTPDAKPKSDDDRFPDVFCPGPWPGPVPDPIDASLVCGRSASAESIEPVTPSPSSTAATTASEPMTARSDPEDNLHDRSIPWPPEDCHDHIYDCPLPVEKRGPATSSEPMTARSETEVNPDDPILPPIPEYCSDIMNCDLLPGEKKGPASPADDNNNNLDVDAGAAKGKSLYAKLKEILPEDCPIWMPWVPCISRKQKGGPDSPVFPAVPPISNHTARSLNTTTTSSNSTLTGMSRSNITARSTPPPSSPSSSFPSAPERTLFIIAVVFGLVLGFYALLMPVLAWRCSVSAPRNFVLPATWADARRRYGYGYGAVVDEECGEEREKEGLL